MSQPDYHSYMLFSHFTKYTLNMGFEGQIFIHVNAQIIHRFGLRYGSTSHFYFFISTAQEVHKLSLSTIKAQFVFAIQDGICSNLS